jgi:hypothetical protein
VPLTATQLRDKLNSVIAEGKGDRLVCVMDVVDGNTEATEITDCFAAEDYDGEIVWIV